MGPKSVMSMLYYFIYVKPCFLQGNFKLSWPMFKNVK